MLGLGNSVGTPPTASKADVLVVHSFEELDAAGRARQGTNRALQRRRSRTTARRCSIRGGGPSRAAALGAVAALVRSVGPPGLRTPHTGALRYAEGSPQIPAAAITTEDADRLQRMQDRGTHVRRRLKMEAKFLPDADSFNVVGEIRGRERPDEVVVVGGHFDSWDVGTGSTDDGGGCVVTWEALRLMKKLNLRPRRTVRVVLWTNEENGGAGRQRVPRSLPGSARQPRADARIGRRRVPSRRASASPAATRRAPRIKEIATLLRGIQADRIGPSGGRRGHRSERPGRRTFRRCRSSVDGNYFLIHHTPADTIDKIDPMDMSRASAAIAVMTYVVAEMPERAEIRSD